MRIGRCGLGLLVLCLLFVTGEAIKCYSCNFPDEKCGDRFAYTQPEANECYGSCVKRRGKRTQGAIEVYRGCHTQTETTCQAASYVGMSVTECFCNEEYCNHSNQVKMSVGSLVIAFVTVLYNVL
ncbi:UPAR/Ly6 domain-containing protein qvr-like [Argopecten irradians]|uniref:UPAR/Ly6 domain-containing protein qvr-like n=1 Tax=Argopecten irradians TaxID=31199 RepID=UPI00371D8CEC